MGDDGTDRRTFLKQALAGGVCAAAAMSGCMRLATEKGGRVEYLGARVIPGSPTDHGVPVLLVAVDDDGYVIGRPPTEGAHLYCAQKDADLGARLFEDPGDERLRYDLSGEKLAAHGAETFWYSEHNGEPVHVDHFADRPLLTGASVRWRGGPEGQDGATLILLKLDPDKIEGAGPAQIFANDHGLVAFSDLCTHFCCRAGWHEDEIARTYDAWDTIFCTCHSARFDPQRVERYTVNGRDDRP
ncbi:MAG: Rieske 2Fe-2S domain-containing protein [Euryarchaeota archaeon]|nr:Rieske 2Fe-2S domain-containing protein [Euryarchaeota archaeon]